MPAYLGLDSSTQSLSAVIIDTDTGELSLELSVNFGKDLPEYASPHGFLPGNGPRIVHADPLLWAAALDLMFQRIVATGSDLKKVQGIGGAGQQHGSVYLKVPVSSLGGWSTAQPLAAQVAPLLSRRTSPIWMDSSTSAQCAEIASAVGGHSVVTRITGSRATERFTGPQIRKFYQEEPGAYAATREIHLVSSFIASLLTGRSAPIDLGDGSGMNLVDLRSGTYSEPLLEATAPGLKHKLPPIVPSPTPAGTISSYFVERYGLQGGTPVLAFSGDNPSSLVGMGATEPSLAVVSLGTSDTYFQAMPEPVTDPNGYGHVFGNPAGGFMSLICFTNGSLAREAVARAENMSWEEFSECILERTQPGNGGNFMLPYFVPESTPRIVEPITTRFGSAEFVAGQHRASAARAIVEAQALSMRMHSAWIGARPKLVLLTGGASQNPGIRQVLADVLQADIRCLSVSNSSALGGALRAAQAFGNQSFPELYAMFCQARMQEPVCPKAPPHTYDDLEAQLAARLGELVAPAPA